MELVFVFLIFTALMALSLVLDISMLFALAAGFVLFVLLSLRRGFKLRAVLGFAFTGVKESFIVVGILLIIGCLTGIWRLSGTVAYFVSLGVSLIPPKLFLPAAFLLSALMSFALGTSFGVTATAGVILMSIARAAGTDPILAAGAILSGVYVGDRGSPAASSANLVASVTHTDMRENVPLMLRCSILPFLLCCAIYALLSLKVPVSRLDTELLSLMGDEFELGWYCLIPAVLMIALPLLRVDVKLSMAISLVSAAAVAILCEHESLVSCLGAMLAGYTAKTDTLAPMLSGGGIVSMLEVCGILIISCSYGGIFRGTGLLSDVNAAVGRCAGRLGRFPTMLVLAVAVSALFCNQTIGIIMQSTLAEGLYAEEENRRKMLDIENSVILIAGLVPWCIASSVPLRMLNVGGTAVFAGFYLWLVPLWWLLRGRSSKVIAG